MKTLTIRNVSPRLAEALEREKQRRRQSLNAVVLDVLAQGLGVGGARKRSNGLARLSGTWSDEEQRQFEEAVAPFERVDEDLWR
jgi:hypothetical protein